MSNATKADILAQIEALIVAKRDIESETIESSSQLFENRAKMDEIEEMILDLQDDLNDLEDIDILYLDDEHGSSNLDW